MSPSEPGGIFRAASTITEKAWFSPLVSSITASLQSSDRSHAVNVPTVFVPAQME